MSTTPMSRSLGSPETVLTHPVPVTLTRGTDALADLHAFVDALCATTEMGEEERFAFKLAAEEAYTNIVTHGYGAEVAQAPVELQGHATEHEIGLVLIDRGEPFDPHSAPPADVDSGWEERPIGGVGWHLIRKLTDRIRYQPNTPSGNRLMLVKRRASSQRRDTHQEAE